MFTPLKSTRLATGEPFEIGVVLTPEATFRSRVVPFLGHKPGNFQWHFECAFEPGRISDLETRFYLGLLDETPICNIMTVEYDGIGILGHVYTRPEHRRKGACRLVMTEQMADFGRRNGRYLTLGTWFQSHPYWIYHGFGFRSISSDSGFMCYRASDTFETEYFVSADVNIVKPTWKDWPTMNVLCTHRGPPYLRNVAFELYGQKNFEGGFLTFLKGIEENPIRDARILRSATGAIVGYAMIQPDRRWAEQTLLLDLYLHPQHTSHAFALLQSLPLPENIKIQSFTENDTDWKIAALLAEGFEHEATFQNQFEYEGRPVDVEIYGRGP
ncbi:MAG: hypothetical protein VYA69_11775 [Gemmatimonadota bacterium]|nr:hypothetical protein [Gemmatimonadota bacterium]